MGINSAPTVTARPSLQLSNQSLYPLQGRLGGGAHLPPINTKLDMGSLSLGLPSPKFPLSPTTPDSADSSGFTPYFMDIVNPKAPELLRLPKQGTIKDAKEDTGGSATKLPNLMTSLASDRVITPESSGNSSNSGSILGSISLESIARQSSGITTMRIKRSISTLLQRSSSMLRRGESTLRRQNTATTGRARVNHHREDLSTTPFLRSNAPTPEPGIGAYAHRQLDRSDLAGALTASQFNVSAANTMISPLIGNSMLHVKVVMDAGSRSIVVVPMVRTMVFARARERILTKLYQGGVAFVESKSKLLALRRPDGTMAVIENNPTWRTVMDVASKAHCQQAKAIVAGTPTSRWAASSGNAPTTTNKTVVKLTLYLINCPKN
ncbi:hypothetical protein COEREDRAFT_79236 [Coemansia reversa NRRL 1564]|uniref:Uncharacterized protein n=1 Tax=Coemansia reversa (strain ATCC 12441 / NRRL 1564) TaxID=763665 RepID=A0A2G5BJS4_COERN|nr:hypothetical protein COEREDRAFT_79236 [Coemansia reversa NRRL 1564]|eukprot:PIA19284.1 hypothetical protein COEREDRAFT_79236 [Coemansia reversa NRRL 1564]